MIFIASFSNTRELSDIKYSYDKYRNTNINVILDAFKDGETRWSVPKNAAPGDTIVFMCSKTARDNLVNATANIPDDYGEDFKAFVKEQKEIYKQYSGYIIGYGTVSSFPKYEGDWFMSDISELVQLENMVFISEFKSFIKVTQFGSITYINDDQWDLLKSLINRKNPGLFPDAGRYTIHLTADEDTYDKSVDVINQVFFPDYTSKSDEYEGYQRGGLVFYNNDKRYNIWFPKMSVDGRPASNSGWINTFSQGEEVILERGGYNPYLPKEERRIVFTKTGQSPYTFKGIYEPVCGITTETDHYYKRIARTVELTGTDIVFSEINQDLAVEKKEFKRVLFCNIAYMKEYRGITADDRPINGGEYVKKENDAMEKYNFSALADGTVKGFVETKHKGGYKAGIDSANQLHIENIDRKCAKANSVDNVLVVFCATKEKSKGAGRVIVGWYDNATVYRKRKTYSREGDSCEYNIETTFENMHLIKEDDRIFHIPSAREGEFGLGQANVKYVLDDKGIAFTDKVIDYLETMRSKTDSEKADDQEKIADMTELSDTGKEAIIRLRVGQSKFRKDLMARDGKCRICGLKNESLLRASHIKAWASCEEGSERVDVNNGIILCAIHDALFDSHLITFGKDGELIVSHSLSEEDRKILDLDPLFKLEMNDAMKGYMAVHRRVYFKDSQYVEHKTFGKGKIVKNYNEKIEIKFDDIEDTKEIKKSSFDSGVLKKI